MEEIETRMGMKGRKMMLCKTYVKQYQISQDAKEFTTKYMTQGGQHSM